MKLAYSPASPFVRKVLVLLHETGQVDDVALDGVATTPIDADKALLSYNPLGKLPALERPDGASLYDSRVICSYLNDRSGGSLYGTGARHWEILTLEATGDGIMDAAVSMTYEGRVRPADKQYPAWVEGQWEKVSRACVALNTRWMSHLSGPLDMGQISVACALSYLDFRQPSRDWRKGNDALAAWYATFDSRPSMAATRPPAA